MSEFLRKKWTLTRTTLADLFTLCAGMRADELEQWAALVDPEPFDVEAAVCRLYQLPGVKNSLFAGDRLLVAGGYFEVQPGVWRSWMVGTQSAWNDHWRSITEATRFTMGCLLDEPHIRRLETYALASRALTGRWYERGLGMQKEGILREYAFNGADVAVYSLTRSRVAPAPVLKAMEASHGL